jgi:hypothetical protein
MFVLPRTQSYNFQSRQQLANGLNKIGNNQVALYTNNVNRLHIDNSGNVGIGSINPAQKLDVNGNLQVTGDIGVSGAILPLLNEEFDLGTTALRWRDLYLSGSSIIMGDSILSVTDGKLAIDGANVGGAIDEDEDTYISAENPEGADNDELQFFTAGVERMRITSLNGSLVGIGTDGPLRHVHIYRTDSNINNTLRVENGNTGASAGAELELMVAGDSAGDPHISYLITGGNNWSSGVDNSDSNKFKISQNAFPGTNDYFNITTTGNVGIGTDNPTSKLHVNGSLGIEGSVSIGVSFVMDSNWNLNIGPQLDSDSNDHGIVTINQSGPESRNLVLRTNDNTKEMGIGWMRQGGFLNSSIMQDFTTSDLVFRVGPGLNNSTSKFTDQTERMRILDSGNVGIGTDK